MTNLIPNWSQLGLLLHTPPSSEDLDLERLLLATARQLPHHARLFPLVTTWLTHHGNFIARHRLKRLIITELEPEYQPHLALLLESAIKHGTSPELRIAIESCSPAREPHPLFAVQQKNKSLAKVAERNASPLSRKWGVWAPKVELKPDALRPVLWLLKHNPKFRGRIIRKGDLRCSILETLKSRSGILPDNPPSESALARACAATRPATRNALAALLSEGEITITKNPHHPRHHAIQLCSAECSAHRSHLIYER